jgi:hypothetical protein
MTVNVARRTRRRATPPAPPSINSTPTPQPAPEPVYTSADTFRIGEIEQTVFDCPNCRRPLALGARRCPGCQTRLVNGVVLTKVGMFVAGGLTIGIVAGSSARDPRPPSRRRSFPP